jgi:hypothetical protein
MPLEIDIVQLVGQVGFPIGVTIYLLYERSRDTKELKTAVENNTNMLAQVKEVINKCQK